MFNQLYKSNISFQQLGHLMAVQASKQQQHLSKNMHYNLKAKQVRGQISILEAWV